MAYAWTSCNIKHSHELYSLYTCSWGLVIMCTGDQVAAVLAVLPTGGKPHLPGQIIKYECMHCQHLRFNAFLLLISSFRHHQSPSHLPTIIAAVFGLLLWVRHLSRVCRQSAAGPSGLYTVFPGRVRGVPAVRVVLGRQRPVPVYRIYPQEFLCHICILLPGYSAYYICLYD